MPPSEQKTTKLLNVFDEYLKEEDNNATAVNIYVMVLIKTVLAVHSTLSIRNYFLLHSTDSLSPPTRRIANRDSGV